MMDCKKALTESGGDFDGAIEYLRKKGQKLSEKRADRDAKEGVVLAKVNDDQTRGVIIRLSCETDFVAKNDDFVELTSSIADLALEKFPSDKEALLDLEFQGMRLGDKITEQIGVIGEKIELADYERMEAAMIESYIHMGNKAGVLVGLNKANADFSEAGKDIAMQIAAMKPIAVNEDGVDQSVIDKEIEIGKDQARQEGKPEDLLERIAKGKLNKFFKENTLLHQTFVKDNSMSVQEFLKTKDKELTVTDFKHVALG